MAISASIPTLWAAQLLYHLDKKMVYVPAFTNSNYQGEVQRFGDTVKIIQAVDPMSAIKTYTGAITYDALTDTSLTLTIDQKKHYAFEVEDITDQFSMMQLATVYGERYGYAAADHFDQHIATFHASADTSNLYGSDATPIVVGGGAGEVAAYEVFLELNQRLSDNNAPDGNRRIVVPNWFYRRLKKELGLRETPMGDTVTVGGVVTTIDGVQVFTSNNVPNTTGTKYKVMMGNPVVTHARVLQSTEQLRLETKFSSGIRGLFVYGSLCVQPKELAVATINKGAL